MTQSKTNITLAAGKTLSGVLPAISSKSELHRLIFCACLSARGVRIHYSSELSKDIEATISCFKALGAEISVTDGEIFIEKPISREFVENNITADTEIFCGESGSTARFLLPLLSLFCKNGVTMTGAGKLPQRPFSDLCRCLSAGENGAFFSSEHLPITVIKPCEPSGMLEISGNISSQYLSGLLFILPFCRGAKIKLTTALESSGYVDMTIEAMRKFGVSVKCSGGVYSAHGCYRTPCDVICVGGDWSNAAFFLCAAKENEAVTLTGIDAESLQPDRKICEILSECGFEIQTGENCISARRGAKLSPFDTDAGENPDLVPILCVLAATINGDSVIRNVSRLKFKESDRIKAVCDMISSLGGKIRADYEKDAIFIHGSGSLCGGTVESFNDHRIVMSAAVASCFCSGNVTIVDSGAVSKSYPQFFRDFELLA